MSQKKFPSLFMIRQQLKLVLGHTVSWISVTVYHWYVITCIQECQCENMRTSVEQCHKSWHTTQLSSGKHKNTLKLHWKHSDNTKNCDNWCNWNWDPGTECHAPQNCVSLSTQSLNTKCNVTARGLNVEL